MPFGKRKVYRLCLDRKKCKGKYKSNKIVNINTDTSKVLPTYPPLQNNEYNNIELFIVINLLLSIKSKIKVIEQIQ